MFRYLIILLLSVSVARGDQNPVASYLSWLNDPTTSMTIQWVTSEGKETHDLFYKKEGDDQWKIALAKQVVFPEKFPFVLHRVELFHLEPNTTYLFKPGVWEAETRKFRTLSNSPDEPLRFTVGGDMYHDEVEYLISTHRQAAKQFPHFAIAGGDIAYTATKHVNSGTPHLNRWITFFKAWSNEMITPDGYTIPIVPVIGNHDVNGRYGQLPDQAVYFYTFFPFPEMKGFHALDIGNYFSLIILDSGHTNHIYGKQSQWLEQTLKERKSIPHKFAAYHVPAYPSVRKYKGPISMQIRQYWVPLFEKYGLTSAFEHHDHAYKRSHPIKEGHIDQNGVIYIGDGAYGIKHPRPPKSPYRAWYLEQTAQERHFILVSIQGEKSKFQAINDLGRIFDQLELESKNTQNSLN